jgi:hypothetical protein
MPVPENPYPQRRELARQRQRQHRRRLVVLTLLFGATALVGLDLLISARVDQPTATGASPTAPTPASQATGAGQGAPPSYPQTGPNTFTFAAGTGQVIGAGTAPVKKFRVAVENGGGPGVGAFAAEVEQVLGGANGWTAGGDVRFQRVPQSAGSDFTLYLATPGTSEKMCAAGGIHTDKATSCRLPGQVIINLARWLSAVPDYGGSLASYQQYEINHHVGRELGHGNEACPGPGQPAPVMQQQTLGLAGCTPYGWPYRGGSRYAGPALP